MKLLINCKKGNRTRFSILQDITSSYGPGTDIEIITAILKAKKRGHREEATELEQNIN